MGRKKERRASKPGRNLWLPSLSYTRPRSGIPAEPRIARHRCGTDSNKIQSLGRLAPPHSGNSKSPANDSARPTGQGGLESALMRTLLSLTAVLFVSVLSIAQSQPLLNLMPMPANVQQGTGQLQITESFSAAVTGTHEASLDSGVQRFTKQLSSITGIPFRANASGAPTLEVHADHGREAIQKLG